MLLKSIAYFEHKGNPHFWEINDVYFTEQNIIIGLNATGKTRLTNIITNLGKVLSSKAKKNGNWEITLEKDSSNTYKYILEINNLIVEKEKITKGDLVLLDRSFEDGIIFSEKDNENHEFSPPKDELTVNVRRDLSHYPFLEDIFNWAQNINGYSFSGAKNDMITIPSNADGYLQTLTTVPYILNKLKGNEKVHEAIKKGMTAIDYPIERISSKQISDPGSLNNLFLVTVKEKDLKCNTDQNAMSQGMYRALCLIVIIEYYLREKRTGLIVVDDLGEGLDFDRSSKLISLLLEKTKGSDIQLIITSNDRFLINAVDLKSINYLTRSGHTVSSINYQNNKKLFDKFIVSGLTNFDLLYSNINKN